MLLFRLEIRHGEGVTQRNLDAGVTVLGGGLQADLVIPALLDPELCELILPDTSGKPIRITALVKGMLVNGRALPLGKSVSAATLQISIDDITIDVSPVASADADDARTILASGPQDRFIHWLDKSKFSFLGRTGLGPGGVAGASGVARHQSETQDATRAGDSDLNSGAAGNVRRAITEVPFLRLVQDNPGQTLLLMAAVFGMLAVLVSGWPSAKLKTTDIAGKVATDKDRTVQLLLEVRRRLVSADIGTDVRADPAGNAIRLTGTADPGQAQRLGEMLTALTKTGGIPIQNEVVMTSTDAATGVEMVVLAPTRGVIASGGRLFREGQTIPSGWRIDKITPADVRMTRDSVTYTIAMVDALQSDATATLPLKTVKPAAASTPAEQRVIGLQSVSTPPRDSIVLPAQLSGQQAASQRVVKR